MKDNKRLYTVSEISSLTGATRKTLFYYDRIGLLTPTDRVGPQAHKVYDEESLARLRMILRYRNAGLRIDEVRSVMGSPASGRREIYEKVLERLRREKTEKEITIRNLMVIMEEELPLQDI